MVLEGTLIRTGSEKKIMGEDINSSKHKNYHFDGNNCSSVYSETLGNGREMFHFQPLIANLFL